MGMLLRFDPEIGMCRSVGDWPNGVLIIDLSDLCNPSFAVDWCFPVEPLNEQAERLKKEGPLIKIPELDEGPSVHLERVDLQEVVEACEDIQAAMCVWGCACHLVSDWATRAAEYPPHAHVLYHAYQFMTETHQALHDEGPNRDNKDGKRID
jgi:hypothetical protein